MRRTVAASLSNALCTLAERSATTSSDWGVGVVWTCKPASAAVSSSTIRVRSPNEMRARRGGSGGGKKRQIAMMMSSASTPAPSSRGRLTSKPTVEGQPLGRHDGKRRERDPRPDLELAAMGRLHDGRPRRRQRQAVGWLELRNRIRKQIHAEPGAIHLAGDDLFDGVEAGQVGFAERRNGRGRDGPAAAVRPDHGHRRCTRLGHDGDGFVRMEAVAGDAGRQQPLTEVLHQDRKRDAQREVGLMEIEADQHLTKGLVADEDERRLQAADQRPAECRAAQVLAAGDVDVLQVDIGQTGTAVALSSSAKMSLPARWAETDVASLGTGRTRSCAWAVASVNGRTSSRWP